MKKSSFLDSVFLMASAAFIFVFALSACSTVAPTIISEGRASYDGNAATSGILYIYPDGSRGVTKEFAADYGWYVLHYGTKLKPPLLKPDGIVSVAGERWDFKIDREHLTDFDLMRDIAANNLSP
jgi:hypothetical protein